MLLHMNSEVCVWVSSSIKLKQNQDLTVTIITTVFTKKETKLGILFGKKLHKIFQLKLKYLGQRN